MTLPTSLLPDDPVFVLCSARSGSTLLRFILDAHPELACPPETNIPGLCVQLATVWALIEGAPLSADRGDEPPQIPEAAIAGVRQTMDSMLLPYLKRRGKNRYCDKSLGTARFADLLLRVYPQAKFVCLYRHPMDVIASGMEACPWGLNGYGFDPYIAATPGNMVHALASFWADACRVNLAVEERFPERSHRVRYEDLANDPESVSAALFQFLDVPAVPGISEDCFSVEHERFGPADYKIWSTSRVTPDSIGRSWSVPSKMVAPHVLAEVNRLAGKLGYITVDDGWGTSQPPTDFRAAGSIPAGTAPAPGPTDHPTAERRAPTYSGLVGDQLRDRLALVDPAVRTRWNDQATETFVAVVIGKDPAAPAEYWLVNLGAGTVEPVGRGAQEDSDWDVVGTLDAWEKVIKRQLNLHVAVRTCQLRFCENDATLPSVSTNRAAVLSHLLGLTNW